VAENDASNKGAGFTFVAQWKFWTDNTEITTDFTSTNVCLQLEYSVTMLADEVDHVAENRYGVFCPIVDSISTTSTASVSEVVLPHYSGTKMYAYGGYSNKNGYLYSLAPNSNTVLIEESDEIDVTAPNFLPPTIKPGMKKNIIRWNFKTPVLIDR